MIRTLGKGETLITGNAIKIPNCRKERVKKLDLRYTRISCINWSSRKTDL